MIRSIVLTIDRISRALSWLGMFLYIGLVATILYEVIARYVFNMPSLWASEASKWIIILMSYLCFSWVLLIDGHIKVDIILDTLGQRKRAAMTFINSIIGLVYCMMTAWLCWVMLKKTLKYNLHTQDLLLPYYVLHGVAVAGFVFLCLQFISRLYKNYHEMVSSKKRRELEGND